MSLLQRLRPKTGQHSAEVPRIGVDSGSDILLPCVARGGPRPTLSVAPAFSGPGAVGELLAWHKQAFRSSPASVVLGASHYRIMPMDAPRVAPEERKGAVRYQVQELLDFAPDDTCIDCIELPAATAGQAVSRLFAVAGQRSEIGTWMRHYAAINLTLDVVDVPEMALRNLSVLAAGDGAHMYIHIGLNTTRLVIVWQKELCAFRQFDLSARDLAAAGPDTFAEQIERVALEVQRTADAYARQFHGAELKALWVSSVCRLNDTLEILNGAQSLTAQALHVQDHVQWQGDAAVHDFAAGRDRTLALGAALRGLV